GVFFADRGFCDQLGAFSLQTAAAQTNSARFLCCSANWSRAERHQFHRERQPYKCASLYSTFLP
ncbi:hypothetical protein, partial [Paratractidigestivibacter sp.]|uniref:hypothetical protein n=1 Tax=Paratractidigestivibacter sp. TaxID=2847316 RepID=UPI002ABE4FD4